MESSAQAGLNSAVVHPGSILGDRVASRNLSVRLVAQEIGVPSEELNRLVAGDGRLSEELALKLAAYFGTSARFWIEQQEAYDLDVASRTRPAA